MHGGVGMTDEFDVGLFMKRAASARRFSVMRISTPIVTRHWPATEIRCAMRAGRFNCKGRIKHGPGDQRATATDTR